MFNPTKHGFQKLQLSCQGVEFYARRPDVLTVEDRLTTLTVFLSQHTDYVTIWFGLFEPGISEFAINARLEKPLPSDFEFALQYNEPLFAGYIADDNTGRTILEALRLDRFNDQRLSIQGAGLTCDLWPTADKRQKSDIV